MKSKIFISSYFFLYFEGVNMQLKEHSSIFYILLALSASVNIATFCIIVKNIWG